MESSKGSADQPVSIEELFKSRNVSVGALTASLFRNRKSRKVVYLEAGKDFADILLSLLLLPIGTIIHLLSKGIHVKPALGGFLNLHESLQGFHSSDLQVVEGKLAQPRPAAIDCTCSFIGLKLHSALLEVNMFETRYTGLQHRTNPGLVTKDTKYLVTDNLEIMLLTTNNSVSVLNKMKVASIADLEGIDITITITQVLQLLQSALKSNTCLSDVFGLMN